MYIYIYIHIPVSHIYLVERICNKFRSEIRVRERSRVGRDPVDWLRDAVVEEPTRKVGGDRHGSAEAGRLVTLWRGRERV